MKRTMFILVLCLLFTAGCLDKKTSKNYHTESNDYCPPVEWCSWTLDGKFPWDNCEWDWQSPCGKAWHCKMTCKSVGNTEAVPAPGAILLGSIGVGIVGWIRRRRIV